MTVCVYELQEVPNVFKIHGYTSTFSLLFKLFRYFDFHGHYTRYAGFIHYNMVCYDTFLFYILF
jgi:hypothetical protein